MNSVAEDMPTGRMEIAADWCMRLADGPIVLEEQLALEEWLDAEPANRTTFERMAGIWHGAGEVADAPQLIGVRADALEAYRLANRRRWSGRIAERWRPVLAMAACLVLILVSGVYYLTGRPDHYETGIGERRVVRLADGSRLSLDAATSVSVDFSDERRAITLLAGRAKFDVAKDPRRVFTVAAGHRVVVATGTAFSVELVQQQMRVVLYEGNVAVLEDGPSDQPPRHLKLVTARAAADQALKPGSMMIASLNRPTARVEVTDLPRSISWEGGQLTFTDEPLAVAAERINRYSDIKIAVADGATARLEVSGAFNAGDTEGFIEGVSALYALRTSRSGNVIALRAQD